MEDVNNITTWYKALSDDFKNYIIFRWERMGDKEVEQLYGTMKAAEKLCRSERAAMKKAKKKENHERRPESP